MDVYTGSIQGNRSSISEMDGEGLRAKETKFWLFAASCCPWNRRKRRSCMTRGAYVHLFAGATRGKAFREAVGKHELLEFPEKHGR